MAHDILQHHDRVINHEAGGQCERQQRQIVEREAKEIHARKRADRSHRQHDGRNERGPRIAQHKIDHQDDEEGRAHQGNLCVENAFAYRFRSIEDLADIHRNRHGFTHGRQHFAHRIHQLHHIGPRLAADRDGERGFAVETRPTAQPFIAADHTGHIPHPHRQAVAIGDNDVGKFRRLFERARGIQNIVARAAGDRSDRDIAVGRRHRGAQIIHRQIARRQRGRIELDTHSIATIAIGLHLANARQGGNPRHQQIVYQGLQIIQGPRLVAHRQDDHRGIRRVDLPETGRIGHFRRQPAGDRRQHGLHIERGGINVAIECKLHGDLRGAGAAGRKHLFDAGNGGKLAFDRRCHRCRHDAGVGTGQAGFDLDGGQINLWQGRHRQLAITEQAAEHDRESQKDGGNRPLDTEADKTHQPALPAGAAGRSGLAANWGLSGPFRRTVSPSFRRASASTTTCSPGFTPPAR